METALEFASHAHPSTATRLELARRADIICRHATHLHEHQWNGFLQTFQRSANGGDGVASHAPDVAGVRTYTGVAILFTQDILADGLDPS